MVKKSLKIRKFSFSEKEFTEKKTLMATTDWLGPPNDTHYIHNLCSSIISHDFV
jgi:hypothetical protein